MSDVPRLVAQLSAMISAGTGQINWNPILGTTSLAVGLGALGAGGYFIYDALINRAPKVAAAQNAYKALKTGSQAEFDALYSVYAAASATYSGYLWSGVGGAAGGVVLTAVAFLFYFLPAEQPAAAAKVSVTIMPPSLGTPLAAGIFIRKTLP
ncbi:MAG: hypothetical protein L7F78_20655 [Syntrophales bacterium LBB04]|nr:hypothetical protein [Syntrophales bacterium LBB04]